MPESQKRAASLIVAGSQAAVAVTLHAVEEALNLVAVFLLFFVKRGGLRPVRPVVTDYLATLLSAIKPGF